MERRNIVRVVIETHAVTVVHLSRFFSVYPEESATGTNACQPSKPERNHGTTRCHEISSKRPLPAYSPRRVLSAVLRLLTKHNEIVVDQVQRDQVHRDQVQRDEVQRHKETNMNSQQNLEIVRKAYQDFTSGNIPALLESLSPEVEWFIPGPTGVIPFAGPRRGRQQVAKFFAALAESQVAKQFEPQEFIESGDKVIVLGHQEWQVKATSRVYADDWAHVFWLHAGKIVRFREYHDTDAEASAHRS